MSERAVVYKYDMPEPGTWFEADMPQGVEFVHYGFQNGRLMAWAKVDPKAPKESRTFVTVGTGHPVAPTAQHVGTAIDAGGFVWHTFVSA